MILPIHLAECGPHCPRPGAWPQANLDVVCGTASARLRLGRVGFAPEWRLPTDGKGMEYPGNHLVLIAKRRGEGSP